MWLVDILVDAWVVLQSVDPVDGNVVESHVQNGRNGQPGPAIALHIAIQQTVAADLGKKPRKSQDVDERNGGQGRLDLLAHLVLEEPRVVLQTSVEDEVIRQCAEDKVEGGCAELGDEKNRHGLAVNVVAIPKRYRWRRTQEVVRIRGIAHTSSGVRQGPCVHLVEDERVEELKCDIHGSRRDPLQVGGGIQELGRAAKMFV